MDDDEIIGTIAEVLFWVWILIICPLTIIICL